MLDVDLSNRRLTISQRPSPVVERRSGSERVIEVVLADRSAIVLARAAGAASSALNSLALEVSTTLRVPLELGEGALLADRFEIERQVARGGMGVIYQARDRSSDERVALKLIAPSSDDSDRIDRFAREGRLLADLDHPRIARHVAHGTTPDEQAFLAMQWLDGADLKATLAEDPLSLSDSHAVMMGAADAIAAVHARGIVHRDLKPSNLFLRNSAPADLVLLDFGVARGVDNKTAVDGCVCRRRHAALHGARAGIERPRGAPRRGRLRAGKRSLATATSRSARKTARSS